MKKIAITGIGLGIPGVNSVTQLTENIEIKPNPDQWFDFSEKLGKKGLRYKDFATKLSIYAVKNMLEDSNIPFPFDSDEISNSFGCVASSNLGNIDTVCNVSETISQEGVPATSSLDLPNASSNIVATTIAIRFKMKALNLMVCSGAISGVESIYYAGNSIRTGRAQRIAVVGAEVFNPLIQRLFKHEPTLVPFNGAAAILLECQQSAIERGAHIYGYIDEHSYSYVGSKHLATARETLTKKSVDLWMLPAFIEEPYANMIQDLHINTPQACVKHVSRSLGNSYGAEGILQTIVALDWLRKNNKNVSVVCNGLSCGEDELASIGVLIN